ncbi:MAG: aldehyde dehydrogenase [Rhodobacteraceae bacterium]|nr:aldehyde dehydrogenase [Paracoccaceae bacterium]MCY4197741.1 aldehyde dehydrogenase [Paracoccaceae bacterium]
MDTSFGIRSRMLRILMLSWLVCAVGAGIVPRFAGAENDPPEFGVLKVANGVENTYYSCVGCHSERLVAQQGLTREGWDEVIDWMIEEQDMPEPETDVRVEILDYLSTHYNVDRPNFPYPSPK